MRRERLWVLEAAPDVVPAGRGPDLRVIARTHDDHLAVQGRVLAQVARQDDPTLAVELDLRRWNARDPGLVRGNVAVLAASSSQP